MLALEIKVREAKETPESLRARGVVPAVFYGPKEESTAISVDALKLEHVWRDAGETTIITLKGAGEDRDTLIHDVQFHPVSGKLLHADFYVLEKGKKVRIKVPIEFIGVPLAEKAGHIVVKTLHEIEIEVAPQELPHNLPVDFSKLENVGDHITVAEVKLPPSATLLTHGEEIVVSVKEFKEEVIEITPPPETIIEGKGPAAEGVEGEAGAAEAAPAAEKSVPGRLATGGKAEKKAE